ncbi:hypothetical protein QFC22_005577 [Naganishia vaughanmartiniae]|uniref:Uncharacterized protein n=1 Tax=Naganishia vaughanmartiniae TaxID=1424756 RepID=A0ACC2WV54_9TREE|nr:hypothetical protein QFC22_005577 [Naganishia vaughanmartiniae]
MSDSVNIVLQEQFVITDIDKEGKKFDKVSRLTSYCEVKKMEVTLDYASELINFSKADRISVCLARSLQLDPMTDGGKEGKREMWRGGEQGLAEQYDYVMYGKTNAWRPAMKLESSWVDQKSGAGLSSNTSTMAF